METCSRDENNILQCHTSGAYIAVLEDSIKLGNLVVTMYYASWSPHTPSMYETMAQLAKLHPGVIFVKLDTEETKDISMRMGIRSVPTVILVHKGKEVSRLKRGVSFDTLHNTILSLTQPHSQQATRHLTAVL